MEAKQRELFAITHAGSGEFLWAGVATREAAEATAIVKAANHGNVNLLSGADLAAKLTKEEGP